jgi:hypothetical protein
MSHDAPARELTRLQEASERADGLRSPWRANELRSVLAGASIELSRSAVPLAERDLLGSPEVTVRCTAEESLERMSEAFDEVKAVVARFGEAWDALTPRVAAAQSALDEARALAAGLGDDHRHDLDDAARAVSRIAASASADPLSTAPGDVDRLIGSLREVRRDLDATDALRRDFDARITEARGLLASLEASAGDGRTAHDEAIAKISVPSAAEPPVPPVELGAELDGIAELGRSGGWRAARLELDAWRSRTEQLIDEARQAVRANRAPIEARNQFRALLEAYQVKAQRRGLAEDPELEQIFARAHDALYTAPTDLALVAQLIRRYQEMISSAAEEAPR